MKTWRGIGAGMLLLVVLTGCSGPTEPNTDEVQEWLGAWDDADVGPDALGMVAGLPTADGDGVVDEGITLGSLGGVTVTSIEFSCFGEQTMSVEYSIVSDTESKGVRVDDLACDDSPHPIAVSAEDVTDVRVNGFSPRGLGAWAAVPRGQD